VAHLLRSQNPIKVTARNRLKRSAPPLEFSKFRWRIKFRREFERLPVVPEQYAKLGLADAHRILQHGLEYRLQLAGRRADDLQHIRRCGLLLSRFRQFAGKSADLLLQIGKG
jgi:hypothetical protein